MVIDDCDVKPKDFPKNCYQCPWVFRCRFTNDDQLKNECKGCPVYEDGHKSKEMCSECDVF